MAEDSRQGQPVTLDDFADSLGFPVARSDGSAFDLAIKLRVHVLRLQNEHVADRCVYYRVTHPSPAFDELYTTHMAALCGLLGTTHPHTDGRLYDVMTGYLTSRVWRARLPRDSAIPSRKFAKARFAELIGVTKAAVHGGLEKLPAALASAQAAHGFDPEILEEDLHTLCGDALTRTALSSFGPAPDGWE